jgi:hypothetical protein
MSSSSASSSTRFMYSSKPYTEAEGRGQREMRRGRGGKRLKREGRRIRQKQKGGGGGRGGAESGKTQQQMKRRGEADGDAGRECHIQ